MISLAIMLALQDANFGTYGETLWWNRSPVMATGDVSARQGIWVNALPSSASADTYTDQVSVTTRFTDPIKQTLTMARLLRWVEDANSICKLSCEPIIHNFTLDIVDISRISGASYDAVDSEGRWVESLVFNCTYKLPQTIPSDPVE